MSEDLDDKLLQDLDEARDENARLRAEVDILRKALANLIVAHDSIESELEDARHIVLDGFNDADRARQSESAEQGSK